MSGHGSRLSGAWNERPWTSNPLMTGSRRWEMALRLVLTAVLVLSVPVVAAVGTAMYDSLRTNAERAAAETRTVEATLQEDAEVEVAADAMWSSTLAGVAPATWTVDGIRHTGDISTDGNAEAGETVTIWVDSAGDLTAQPRSTSDAATDAVVVAVFTWIAMAGVAVAAAAGAHVAVNARRFATWDTAWAKLDSENPTSR